MRYGVVLHSSSHVVDRCSVIQSLSVSVTACAGYTPVQAVTGCVPVSVLVAVFLFLWELTPGRHNGFRLFRSVVTVSVSLFVSPLLVSSFLFFPFALSIVECVSPVSEAPSPGQGWTLTAALRGRGSTGWMV